MTEEDIQNLIRGKLVKRELHDIEITRSTSAANLLELIGELDFSVIVDSSDWRKNFGLRADFFQGITPDVVITSRASGENRIIVEAKVTEMLGYGEADSQIVRYFLHLLATSSSGQGKDIRRAVLLAAPSSWFDSERTSRKWRHFLSTYTELATSRGVDITLGEIHCNSLIA